ncbi:MAG: monovalent cation/H(+) antiporter subunit G [Devosia sp.]|nr:monovalent cation/H(+) antiporter subunit G [Devosia sp.]
MIVELCQYVAGILVMVGAVFSLIAAVGVVRLPDLYTRMHAATKTGVVGAGFVLLGVAFAAFAPAAILRALAGIVFLILSSPVAAHLLARAAFGSRHHPTNITVVNVLAAEIGNET